MSQPDFSTFSKYIPGFEFLQGLTQQAAGTVSPAMQGGLGSMSRWIAPTFDIEELDKRIQDLKAVHFWLDQNTKALAATIQALEVQRMTLATLKGMNVSIAEMSKAMHPTPAQPAAEAPASTASDKAATNDTGSDDASASDPLAWWGSLTRQFQEIAGNTMRDMADQASRAAEQMAQTVQAGAEAASQTAAQASAPVPAPRKAPAKKAAAKKSATTSSRRRGTSPG